jgi:hypothetical protein
MNDTKKQVIYVGPALIVNGVGVQEVTESAPVNSPKPCTPPAMVKLNRR